MTKNKATYRSEENDHLKQRRMLSGTEEEEDLTRIIEVRDRQLLDELEERERRERFTRWTHRFRPDAEVASDNSFNKLVDYIPTENWENDILLLNEGSQESTQHHPIRLYEESSDSDEESETDDEEASFQRYWRERRPEPQFVNEPDPNPTPRRHLPFLDFNNIGHLLPANQEDYLGPP
jgi:hypothetical protein